MKNRLIVAAIGIPALLAVIFFTPIWGWGIVVAVMASFCAWELLLRRETGAFAEKAHLELVALHDRERFLHVFIEDVHDRAHFLGRTAPVFRGKGVDREVFDADGLAVVADAAKRLGAVSVTGRARQTALFRRTHRSLAGAAAPDGRGRGKEHAL